MSRPVPQRNAHSPSLCPPGSLGWLSTIAITTCLTSPVHPDCSSTRTHSSASSEPLATCQSSVFLPSTIAFICSNDAAGLVQCSVTPWSTR